ncbi:MAG: diversity-generating retroelement protein Avd [Planctomycetota bacterium]
MEELKVVADFYEFMLWLVQHTEKFPRQHRYSLGIAIENRLQTLLALLLRAKYAKAGGKVAHLTEANLELEILRFQLRLAKDLRALPLKSHEYAAKAVQGLGTQIGGWLKSQGQAA